jgi:glycoprotein endo-alpha-1,2-mannosidase
VPRIRTATIIVVLALALTAPVRASDASGPQSPVTMTRLRIEITTSSDWARVHLEGLAFPTVRVLREDANVDLIDAGDMWTVVNHTGAPTTFVMDTITSAIDGRSTVLATLDQGGVGTTTAALHDDQRGTTPVVMLGTAAGQVTHATTTLTSADALGPNQLRLPHAEPRRLVLASYYPWFNRTGNSTTTMADQPAEPRSAWLTDDVRSHVRQARGAGIDGFVTSWAGASENGPAFDLVLNAEEAEGGTATAYLETLKAKRFMGNVDTTLLARWLDEALQRAASPAFLRATDGVPVVFVFAMGSVDAATWRAIADDSARRGRPVHLVGDADPSTHGPVLYGWHRYSAFGSASQLFGLWQTMAQRVRGPHVLDPSAPLPLSLATVSPGYDDSKVPGRHNAVVPRGANGERYDQTWDAAVKADPDWILVTSWNEWFEGTSVEPGKANGDLALRQTALRAAQWKQTVAPA